MGAYSSEAEQPAQLIPKSNPSTGVRTSGTFESSDISPKGLLHVPLREESTSEAVTVFSNSKLPDSRSSRSAVEYTEPIIVGTRRAVTKFPQQSMGTVSNHNGNRCRGEARLRDMEMNLLSIPHTANCRKRDRR